MALEIRLEDVPVRRLAAVRAPVESPERLAAVIFDCADQVWRFLRERDIGRRGHNVVVYYDGIADIAGGVEVFVPFEPRGSVQAIETPAGRVATATHSGPYQELPATHEAIRQWCRERGHSVTGLCWEVYGDWYDEPYRLRTDVYYLLAASPG